jgi:hypothetical protein
MKRTANDITRAYEIHRKALAASCKAYDRGEKWEALRLATAVYTMVHDRGAIKSIFSQGEIKNKIVYFASGMAITEDDISKFDRSTPLIQLDGNKRGKVDFVPLCTYYKRRGLLFAHRYLSFEDWWENDIIAFDTKPDKPVIYLDLHGGKIPKDPQGKAFKKLMAKAIAQADEIVKGIRDDGLAAGTRTKLTMKQLVFAMRNQDGGGHFDSELRNPNYISLLQPVFMFSYPKLNVCVNLELAIMRQIAEELRLTLLANGAKNNGDLPQVALGFTKDGKWYPISSLPKLPNDGETPC